MLSTAQEVEFSLPLPLEDIYRDLHAHPELSFQEHRTASHVAAALAAIGVEVITGVGGTGVVGVIHNGPGQTVAMRADMDALPILEATNLPYASTARGTDRTGRDVPTMHACGHDMHTTSLIGAVEQLVARRTEWSGTAVAVFQPAEEEGGGAQAMVDDGLYQRAPRPDVVFGQHLTTLPADRVALHAGVAMSAAESIDITMYGRGGHGSRPEETIDPVVMASATALRLNTVVSREISAFDSAVITVGQIHAGTKNNIISDRATLGISVRTFDRDVRQRVLDAITRVVRAEAAAAGAPREPEITVAESFPLTVNDVPESDGVRSTFERVFGAAKVEDPGVSTASEDVSVLATSIDVPLVFWLVGMTDPTTDDVASPHHSATFAPVIQPTLDTGVRAMTEAVIARLAI